MMEELIIRWNLLVIWSNNNRYAQKKGARGTHTQEELKQLMRKQHLTCPACLRKFGEDVRPTIDHVLPLSKGGDNAIGNIQFLCWECNQLKRDSYIKFTPCRMRTKRIKKAILCKTN